MKNLIKILFLLIITKYSFSQENTVFNYNYPLEWNYDCQTMVMHNGNYLFSGNIARTTEACEYWLFGYHVTKINEDGSHDTTIIFDQCNQTTYIGWKNSFLALDTDYFVLGMIYSESDSTSIFLQKLSNTLESINMHLIINDSITKRYVSFCNGLSSSNITICGGIDSSYNEITCPTPAITYSKSSLMSITTNGNILWSKSYSFGDISDGCWSLFYRVIPTHDSGYIAIGITYDFGNRKALVVKTDSIGNQQWFRTYGNSSYHNPGFSDIIPTRDSCYIVCGAYTYGETFGGLYPYDGWIIKIDNNGNMVWDRKYRERRESPGDYRDTIYCELNSIIELDNGNLVAVGKQRTEPGYSNRTPFVYYLNAFGDTLFSKHYFQYEVGHPDYINNCEPNTIVKTNDNGFAIGGWAEFIEYDEINQQWTNPQRIFLIKTDSLGNDTIISDISPFESKPIAEFKLECYPNPASSEFYVELPQGIDNDVLEIYSTNGSLVLQQNVGIGINRIGVLGLEPGMYLVRLKESGLFGKIIVN